MLVHIIEQIDLCVHVFASLVATFVVNKHLHRTRGAGATYPGGARAPPLLRVEGAGGGTGLEELQTPSGKLTI